jgi:hypothetical protein
MIYNTTNWISKFLLIAAIIFYATYLLSAIFIERALYADGSNFFVNLLINAQHWPIADDSKHIRLFINLINQFPTAVALESGVTDIQTLKVLFGAGLFLMPPVFYAYCLYLSKRANDFRVFFFSIVSLITCAIPSDIFILNQAFTTLALTWVIFHYLLLNLKITWLDWIVVCIISLILFRSHESLIIWGAIIFAGSIGAIIFKGNNLTSNQKRLIYTIGSFGVLQSIFVCYWQLSHPVSTQTSAFLQLASLLNPTELWKGNTRISLLIVIALLLVFTVDFIHKHALINLKTLRSFITITLTLCLGLMLFTGASSFYDFSLTDPVREFRYRFLLVFGTSGWMLAALLIILTNTTLKTSSKLLNTIVLSTGIISASLWQISNNVQWAIFINSVSDVLKNSSKSLIDPIEVQQQLTSLGYTNTYKYRWNWAWPVLGMSLQNTGLVEKLYKPEGFEAYFNPPKQIPFIAIPDQDIGSHELGIFRFDQFPQSVKDTK